MNPSANKLGAPDLKVAGLQIWIHNRLYPECEDYWDGNWVNVTSHCWAHGSDVWASGTELHLSELESWRKQIASISKKLQGKAELGCLQPNLFAQMEIGSRGEIGFTVRITPDHMNQTHEFRFEIDQSYLSGLISQLRAVLHKFPVKGKP
jgi:hypothetical protein